MNNVRKLVRDLDRGVNLEKNLLQYAEILGDTYLGYAAVELTFSFCILVESVPEYAKISPEEKAVYEEVRELVKRVVEEDRESCPALIEEAKGIREKITAIMEVFTSYTDRMICYDYVLKRMELRFSSNPEALREIESMKEDDFVSRYVAYVAGAGDKSVVRDRLQQMMGDIPVRMTKNKFLERVAQTFTLYRDSDRASLDSFVYMIRSAAMLQKPDESVLHDRSISDFLERLADTDLTALDEEAYQKLCGEMEEIAERIKFTTDFYYTLQRVVNRVYAVCLARLHGPESSVYLDCLAVLRRAAAGEEWEDGMERLEGRIEQYVERSSYLEAALWEVRSSCASTLKELGLYEDFEDYAVLANLLSDSLFIDLEKAGGDGKVDAALIEQVSREVEEELSNLLTSLSKPLRRAVMAAVLEKLPVTFQNTQEIEAYVRTNLFGCQDFSEKGVVLLELEDQMREDTYFG